MGLIREPLDVDFYVVNRQPTKKELEMMSEHIRKYKENHSKKDTRKILSRNPDKKLKVVPTHSAKLQKDIS